MSVRKITFPRSLSLIMPTAPVRKLAFYALPSLAAFVAFALVLASCGSPTPTPECLAPQDGSLVPAGCPTPEVTVTDEVPPPPPPPPPPPLPGAQLFVGSGCGGCHTIEGVSPGQVGPDLTHIGGRDAGYIRTSILEPNAVIASDCPGGACPSGVMPQSFGDLLSDEQLDTLVDYLVSLK